METSVAQVRNILTRTTGFLRTVSSHSAQPYRGCTLGSSLCGVGCYVQHNRRLPGKVGGNVDGFAGRLLT